MVVPRRMRPVAAALLALLAAAPAAEARRQVPHGFFGVMWDGSVVHAADDVQEEQWALMSRTGVESVRAVFSWADAQPSAGSPPTFTRTDQVVTLAAEHGMRVLPVVLETPHWAKAYDHAASPPKRTSSYDRYLRALVERYGPRGTFWNEHPLLPKRAIRTWQIWNEPHLSYRWYAKRHSSYAWPRGYLRLLKAAHTTLKRADRHAKVVLAGLTNDSWNQLRRLYRGHARPYFDVAAIQTYTGSPKNALLAIRLFRKVMAEHRDARKPIWATETGWPAALGRMKIPRGQRRLVSSDRGMAKRLSHDVRGGGQAQAPRSVPRVPHLLVHVELALPAVERHLRLRRPPVVLRGRVQAPARLARLPPPGAPLRGLRQGQLRRLQVARGRAPSGSVNIPISSSGITFSGPMTRVPS